MTEPLTDVWRLENNSEMRASDELNWIIDHALNGNRKAINLLRKLWDNEEWESIKKKLAVEGSCWYVWYMDGVHALMNYQKDIRL